MAGIVLGHRRTWPDGARRKRSRVHDHRLDAVARSDLGQAQPAIERVLAPTTPADADVVGQRRGVVNTGRANEGISEAWNEDRRREDTGPDPVDYAPDPVA